jgi:energy-coupling factor transporter ATP-binding protein EcfA2
MIKRIKDYQDRVLDQFKNGSQVGEPSGLPFLDPHLKIRPGYFYTVTGWPGSGKSELVLQLAILQAYISKRKVAFYSPESYPVESFIATMSHCYLGKSTDKHYKDVCTEAEYITALEWLNEWFFFVEYEDSPTPDHILEDFKQLRTGYGCKVFVLDPFNSLTNEDGENMALQLKDVLNKFVHFTHMEKAIFFCIEHPRTPRDKEAFDIPGPYQLFGGSMWWNKSDCVFAIQAHREDGRYTGDVTIKVWKMKNQKLNGRPGEVKAFFDIIRNRYYADRNYSGNMMEIKPVQKPITFDTPF